MSLHQKYRPSSLDRVVGHSKAVATLKGFISSGKFPSAIMFTGPTSVGKTTIARAFVHDVLDSEVEGNANYLEVNVGENRSIDDIRSFIQVSRLRPQNNQPRRFILLDEAQQILSNNPAAQALLKPLEQPVATTTFLLSSMEADKFRSTTLGKAIANRCLQISLDPPTDAEMTLQAKRIIKGEGLAFIPKDLISTIVEGCDSSMRNLANVLESLKAQYSKSDHTLTVDDLQSVISGAGSADDIVAVQFLTAVYAGKFVGAQKALLSMNDPVTFINKVTWCAWFMLNSSVLKGARHPKVWGSAHSTQLQKQTNALFDELELPESKRLNILAEVSSRVVKLRLQSGAFSVDESMALSCFAWDTIKELKPLYSTGK